MAIIVKPLTDTEIKNSKPKEKIYKISDGKGLYLFVQTNGTKYFRFDYKFQNKRKSISFGTYPQTSLKEARDKRELARDNIRKNIDPSESKSSNFEIETTFKYVANKWLDLMKDNWSESNYKKVKSNLENNAFPFIGSKEIKNVTRKEILSLLERMESRDATEYASRLLNNIQRIYKYAVTNEYAPHNIIADIDKTNSLKKRQKQHIPALTQREDIKQLLIDINNYEVDFKADASTIYALKLAPYVALRPLNLRFLEWAEIDFEKQLIDIPKEKMKMSVDFVLPLSKQAIKIIKEAELFKSSKYVFPSQISNSRPISENTLNHALHKMGYKDRHSSHGFRSMLSTNAHELRSEHGFNSDVIESCLAHAEPNSVKAAYNRQSKMKYFDEKAKLMQWWADWLDGL